MGSSKKNQRPDESISAVLFADISGSSAIYETLGNLSAQKLISHCLQNLSRVAVRHKGDVVKNIGDEIMCVFPDAELAVEAARNMHMAMQQFCDQEDKKLCIRIGLHQGQIIHKDDDIFGDAVNVAARITTFAKAKQILTTEPVIKSLKASTRTMVRHINAITLKGKREKLNIYEVIWDGQGLTVTVSNPREVTLHNLTLTLEYKDRKIQVNLIQPNISIGRNYDNDLVVDDTFTSRSHALIQYRNGNFILCDKSTNGTYLINGENSIYIHMDECTLQPNGAMSLGRLLTQDSPDAIRFRIHR